MPLPKDCWDAVVPRVKRPVVEEITDARRAELAESERLLQALKPGLATESQEEEPIDFEQLEEELEFHRMFTRVYGTGWHRGYYGDPDAPAICPFADPEQKEIWEQGVSDGFDAHCLLEPKKVLRNLAA